MSAWVAGLRFSIALALTMTVSAGCAKSHGFDQAAMIEALRVDPAPNHKNTPLASQESRLSPPFRLGVFFADHDFPSRPSISKVEWLSADRDQLLRQLMPLRDQHILADTFVLMDATLRAENIRGVRQLGARYGADLVLLVDGAGAVDRYNNRYAWFYPTLIGAYLAPGTESTALVMVTGSLLAVRSEWQAPIQSAEGVAKLVGSAVLVEDNAALKEAKSHAIEGISKRIVDQLPLWAEEFSHSIPHSR